MVYWIGYHKAHEYGDFSRKEFFTNQPKGMTEGSKLFVLSGHRESDRDKVRLRLEGLYEVTGPILETDLRLGKRQGFRLAALRAPEDAIWLESDAALRARLGSAYATNLGLQQAQEVDIDYFMAQLGLRDADFDIERLEDLEEIERDPDVTTTERLELRKARIGQGRFRENVIRTWGLGERCAVTGIAIPKILIASHIKPWRECSNRERLDGTNGVLLSAHLDRLFDAHLLTFADDGRIRIPNGGLMRELQTIGVTSSMSLKTSFLSPSSETSVLRYLTLHRRTCERHD